jgi:type IV secretory pathway VirB4 component
VAPASVKVRPDHLLLDGQFARCLALVGLPPEVPSGWLAPVLSESLPADVALFLAPQDPGATAGSLRARHYRLQAVMGADAADDTPIDPDLAAADEQVEHLRHALARRRENLFSAGLYVLLRASSLAELDRRTRQAQDAFARLNARLAVAHFQQEQGLHSCLPEGRDQLVKQHLLETTSLVMHYPFPPTALRMADGVSFGYDRASHAPVEVDLFDDRTFRSANVLLCAPSGGGKSFFTKLLALRSLLLDDDTDVIVIDRKHEYARLCEAVGGQFLRLAASSAHRINPFDLPPLGPQQAPAEILPDHVQQLIGLLEVLLAEPGGHLSVLERACLDRALRACYGRQGITSDPATHARPVPILADLQAELDESPEPAPSLGERLRPYTSGSLAGGLLNGATTIQLDGRLVVFGLADLPQALWSLAMHLLASYVWTEVRRRPDRQRLLVVDEAWLLLQHEASGAFLEGMARLARYAGLGLVTITQDVKDFLRSARGQAIADNAAAVLLLGQSEATIGKVAETFNLSAGERADLRAIGAATEGQHALDSSLAPNDRRGEGLLLAAGRRIKLKVPATPGEHTLATTSFRELTGRRATPGAPGYELEVPPNAA